MPAPYSCDLRDRVINHYDKHKNINKTMEEFNVCYSTIYDWIKLKKETGSLNPKVGYQKGYGHKIPNLSVLEDLVNDNSSLTLLEISEKLGNNISIMTVSRGLKKLNLTNKKKHMGIKKEMKQSEKYSKQK